MLSPRPGLFDSFSVTTFRSSLLCGAAGFILTARAFAEPPATNTPPGPVQVATMTNVEPATPAAPQPNAKSAPGAQSPNGTNGTTLSGTPVTKAPDTNAQKGKSSAATSASSSSVSAAPAKGTTSAKAKPVSVLDHYLTDLNDTLKLSAEEKKDIQTYYLADGKDLHTIFNDNSISPLQQAQQVSDLRDKRNDKIDALLSDVDRRREFFRVEASYRVALTEAAADGALIPAETPAPAPSEAAPSQSEAPPSPKSAAK